MDNTHGNTDVSPRWYRNWRLQDRRPRTLMSSDVIRGSQHQSRRAARRRHGILRARVVTQGGLEVADDLVRVSHFSWPLSAESGTFPSWQQTALSIYDKTDISPMYCPHLVLRQWVLVPCRMDTSIVQTFFSSSLSSSTDIRRALSLVSPVRIPSCRFSWPPSPRTSICTPMASAKSPRRYAGR